MSLPEPSSLDFTVYHLSLRPDLDGRLAQTTRHGGSFASVDAALLLTRHLAAEEMRRLMESPDAAPEPGEVELIDTEWGYEVRCAGWLIARSWVHDAAACRLQAVGM
jgi:hypothetical protein